LAAVGVEVVAAVEAMAVVAVGDVWDDYLDQGDCRHLVYREDLYFLLLLL
jgi:hypothetical protein